MALTGSQTVWECKLSQCGFAPSPAFPGHCLGCCMLTMRGRWLKKINKKKTSHGRKETSSFVERTISRKKKSFFSFAPRRLSNANFSYIPFLVKLLRFILISAFIRKIMLISHSCRMEKLQIWTSNWEASKRKLNCVFSSYLMIFRA